jgi:alpha-ketoglutarate-dependent taurine dioxygenase
MAYRSRRTPAGATLSTEVERLKQKVAALEQEVTPLKAAIPEESVIVLRSITREQAKQEILELFQSGETLFYSDIARRLRLELPEVVESCHELIDAGEIQIDAVNDTI